MYKPGPLGGGSKVKGVWDARMILGGFFLHEEVNEKVDAGESHALGIESYDPVNKEFITNWYQSDGSRYSGALTITGDTVIWVGPLEVGGKHYQFRETFVCMADFMSGTSKREVSTDGKTWIPFWEAKFVKASRNEELAGECVATPHPHVINQRSRRIESARHPTRRRTGGKLEWFHSSRGLLRVRDVGDAEPVESRGQRGMLFTKAATARSRSSTPGAEDDHVVRARIAHGLQERGHVGDVVRVARRRVAG